MATVIGESLRNTRCRCLRRCLQRLLTPMTNAMSMLVISLTAVVSVGELIARLENYGRRGCNNTLQYAAAILGSGNLTDDQRVEFLRTWSSLTQWNTEEGIYYTYSLFSTIGYGRYSPVTVAGRGVSAVFIVLIVPIGVLHVQCLSSVYQSMLSRMLIGCRQRLSAHQRVLKLIFPNNDSAIIVIPVSILTVLLQLHLLVAILFLCLMERWTPMQSLYYLISATTTIGFGDFHAGPHSLLYVLATITFQIHLCAVFMLIINYLNDALEWILQSYFSNSNNERIASPSWRPSVEDIS